MRLLRKIAEAECKLLSGSLNFEDDYIRDIGPYIVLGLMQKDMFQFLRGGTIAFPVQKVIEAVKLRKLLQMKPFDGLQDHKDVWAFPLRERTPGPHNAKPSKAIGFSAVADDLVRTVNEWLGAFFTNGVNRWRL